MAQLANLADGTQARSLVRQLRRLYDARGAAFQVEEVAGGFQLLTRRKFAPWLRRLEQTPNEMRLSQPASETLAVVAYRQPVLRAEIEAIRGVQCGEILRQLMERDLVRIVGRAEELGRPFLYGTTKRFLQVFGLKHLDELPRADQLRYGPAPVAKPGLSGNDIHSEKSNAQATRSDEEESPVTTTVELNPTEELWTAGAPAFAAAASIVAARDEEEDDDFEDEDEEEGDDEEDYDYEDEEEEEEFEDDDEEEEDEEEEEEDELEGDWEEVEDDEELEDEEEEDDLEEDDEEWEDEDDDDEDEEDWEDEDEE